MRYYMICIFLIFYSYKEAYSQKDYFPIIVNSTYKYHFICAHNGWSGGICYTQGEKEIVILSKDVKTDTNVYTVQVNIRAEKNYHNCSTTGELDESPPFKIIDSLVSIFDTNAIYDTLKAYTLKYIEISNKISLQLQNQSLNPIDIDMFGDIRPFSLIYHTIDSNTDIKLYKDSSWSAKAKVVNETLQIIQNVPISNCGRAQGCYSIYNFVDNIGYIGKVENGGTYNNYFQYIEQLNNYTKPLKIKTFRNHKDISNRNKIKSRSNLLGQILNKNRMRYKFAIEMIK